MSKRNYRRVYGGVAADSKSIRLWFNKLLTTAVETERLVRSNERQDHPSVLFCEPTVTGPVYLDMLEQFVYPQIASFQPSIIYKQDGAPPHLSMDVQGSLNATFPNRWIGCNGSICWPQRSPDLTPLHFYLGV